LVKSNYFARLFFVAAQGLPASLRVFNRRFDNFAGTIAQTAAVGIQMVSSGILAATDIDGG
jgi:hypothetical protein